MLVIRRVQMQAFREAAERSFVRRTLAELREGPAGDILPAESAPLEEEGLAALRVAGSFGITDGPSLARFLTLGWFYGAQFHEVPQLRRILTDTTLVPENRVPELFEQVSPSAWIEIAQRLEGAAKAEG